MTDIIDNVRTRQVQLAQKGQPIKPPLEHRPEMLYIGCIDARLDPIHDIGIPLNKSLIFRNIGALVRPPQGETTDAMDASQLMGNEIPESVSMGAALEFFLKVIAAPGDGRKKHIVISGHTDCGGLKACLHNTLAGKEKEFPYLSKYLSAFKTARDKVIAFTGLSDDEKLHKLEEESVKNSMNNLLSYKAVQDAIEQGRLEVHGWVINTATHRISELNRQTGHFVEMSRWVSAQSDKSAGKHAGK